MSERVARRLSSLSAKYIAVFALLVAVPVICTSVYLLNSSYQDNKRALTRLQQEKARVRCGHDRPVLQGPDQEDDGDVGPLLGARRTGPGLKPLLDDSATDAYYIDRTGHKTVAIGAAAQRRSRGTSCTIVRSGRRRRGGSTSVP